MPLVAPSILASDFLHLADECRMLNSSEADWIHLDVMDGRFVPNISFGFPIIEQMRKLTKKEFDVHLMIEEPERYTSQFRDAGADRLIVHFETCRNLHRNIQQMKSCGLKAGVAINPHTPVAFLADVIGDLDQVLIMSVNPGFGGQHFISHTTAKIRELKQLIVAAGSKTLIEIDGGVTLENAASVVAAGADVLVAGSTVFKSADPIATIHALRSIR